MVDNGGVGDDTMVMGQSGLKVMCGVVDCVSINLFWGMACGRSVIGRSSIFIF